MSSPNFVHNYEVKGLISCFCNTKIVSDNCFPHKILYLSIKGVKSLKAR
jgi:hypothetical protein